MKKIFLLILLQTPLLLLAQTYNSKPITRLYDKPVERTYYATEKYYNGKLMVEGQIVQKIFSLKKRLELKRGVWKWYYRNGQVQDSVFYSDYGFPRGIETRYHYNGTIYMKLDYDTSTNFKIKQRSKLWVIPKDYSQTYFYRSPNIPKRTQVFLNGKKHGSWKYFDKKGNPVKEKMYEKGKLISMKED